MSETFRVGDNVVFRTEEGELIAEFGVREVTASDLSAISVGTWKFNAGTLRYSAKHPLSSTFVIAHPTENELAFLREVDVTAALRDGIDTILKLGGRDEATLRAAYSKGEVPQCQTCTFWRPPYGDCGPGNCHNQVVRQLTRIGNESYPPPTRASFGCNQWKAKESPENGDDSDE